MANMSIKEVKTNVYLSTVTRLGGFVTIISLRDVTSSSITVSAPVVVRVRPSPLPSSAPSPEMSSHSSANCCHGQRNGARQPCLM